MLLVIESLMKMPLSFYTGSRNRLTAHGGSSIVSSSGDFKFQTHFSLVYVILKFQQEKYEINKKQISQIFFLCVV